ncbi:MAG: riboflavin kinase, partial [bacterium]
AGRTRVGDRRFPAAVSIGVRPTFAETETTVEAYLIGFDEEIYGETISISFVHRLRDELKFDSEEELVAQIALDVKNTKEYLNKLEAITEE